jgi:hypothetical protein
MSLVFAIRNEFIVDSHSSSLVTGLLYVSDN